MHQAKFLLLTAVLVPAFSFSAQAQQVTGQVRAADTGQPLYNAVVHCEGVGTNQVQQTDRSGRFTCGLGGPGNFKVRVDLPGYIEEEQSASAPDINSSEYMFFKLKPRPGPKASSIAVIDSNVPAQARAEFEKGQAAVAGGSKEKLEEAIRHFEKAVGIYPNFLQAQLALGAALMDLEQWDKAERTLKKTLEIDPKAANALFGLGEIYLRQKKNEEAERVLLEGLQIDASNAQPHLTLARVYWDRTSRIKDETEARPSLEKAYNAVKKAIELEPNLAAAHLLKGNLLLRVRRAADAQREFEEYLRLDPKGPFAEQTRTLVERIKKALAESK